ncbi:MAG: RNA polymerase sporulation sigma factor SigK [Lachnospiraceae bacterium]|jgi:RNA polymerase sporulation-specific sigma factor|nr:RNA polymerase sporulation sigma factor SigK [Lachnospiraceae bacterium]
MLAISIVGFLAFVKSAIFVIGYIQSSNLFPEPLSSEEESMYLDRFEQGDEDARNILIERNLRLVAHVCKKYNIPNMDNDDLISIGTIGLIKGLNSFKKDKGVRLATYVSRCIDNEILMYLRNSKKIGAEVPLNEPIGKDKDDNEICLLDVLENDEKSIEDELDLRMKIKKLYEEIKSILKGREKTIIELRFGLQGKKPKTQNQIAEMLGISRSYVSRIETKAIGKLNKEFQNEM